MTLTTTAPIKRALVATLRANNALSTADDDPEHRGLSGFFEGLAPRKVNYPFLSYNLVAAPYEYDWSGLMLPTAFDVFIFSDNSVEANNLDGLVLLTLQDADIMDILSPGETGQTTLICRRIADLSSDDTDEEGHKIYQVGGTYSIWTQQSL
jgi:hypothetical protein